MQIPKYQNIYHIPHFAIQLNIWTMELTINFLKVIGRNLGLLRLWIFLISTKTVFFRIETFALIPTYLEKGVKLVVKDLHLCRYLSIRIFTIFPILLSTLFVDYGNYHKWLVIKDLHLCRLQKEIRIFTIFPILLSDWPQTMEITTKYLKCSIYNMT